VPEAHRPARIAVERRVGVGSGGGFVARFGHGAWTRTEQLGWLIRGQKLRRALSTRVKIHCNSNGVMNLIRFAV
jgi:hypothetical protein